MAWTLLLLSDQAREIGEVLVGLGLADPDV